MQECSCISIKRTLKGKALQRTLEMKPWLIRLSFETNEYLIKCSTSSRRLSKLLSKVLCPLTSFPAHECTYS